MCHQIADIEFAKAATTVSLTKLLQFYLLIEEERTVKHHRKSIVLHKLLLMIDNPNLAFYGLV